MPSDRLQLLLAMGAYLAFTIGVGLWYSRRSSRSAEAYFLGERGLGPWVAAMSAEASDMSGWLLMGLPGVAYWSGAGEAAWTAIGLALGTIACWSLVARRLRAFSIVAGNSFTLPAFFSARFHDRRKLLSTVAASMLLFFFSIYVGAQLVTFGKLFGYVLGTEGFYARMVVLGALFVLAYTFIGGFLAETMSDFVQGTLMFCALVLVLAFGTARAGGVGTLLAELGAIPRFTDLFGVAAPVDAAGAAVTAAAGNAQAVVAGSPLFGAGGAWGFLAILSCLAWGLGYFGMPQVLLRFMAIGKPAMVARARSIAVTWCVVALFAAVAIGMIGRALMPARLLTASAAETVFIHLSVDLFPPLLAGLVLSGIIAASISSADSYLLIASSSLANDLVPALRGRPVSDRTVLWIARGTQVAVTAFGIGVALSGNDSIFRVVSYAWAGLGAAFGPLVLFSLFSRRTTLEGAVAGMLTGGVAVVAWKSLVAPVGGAFAVYELLPAFLLSALAIAVVSRLSPPAPGAVTATFDEARDFRD
ncbi:MAG: sodium/proline symporter [Thermoanaerobaculia bacterium]